MDSKIYKRMSNPLNKIFIDDCSPESGPKLRIWEDNQGDLYIQTTCTDLKGPIIRICGAGGGSRYEGLNRELKELLSKY